MKNILNDLFNSFKKLTSNKKTMCFFLFIIYIILLLGVTIKVDYEVLTPGSINATVKANNEDKKYSVIEIDTDNSSGDVNTVGIYSHLRISYFQYLLAQLSNHLSLTEYDPANDLNKAEEYERGVILKNYSIDYALITAYNLANKTDSNIKISYEFSGLVISAVVKNSLSGLKPGDVIKGIEGNSFSSHEEFSTILSNINKTDEFNITVLRDKELITFKTRKYKQVIDGSDVYKLGIEVVADYKIDQDKTFPKYTISNDVRSIGSSGGAMMALSVYNALTEGDITKGKRIVGTGTIDIMANVGPIGGIEQKIVTAKINNADIFFCPKVHYEDALKQYNEINATFALVSVETLEDIINYLEENL